MNKNEMHRVPGFTAEQALERGASTSYAGLALGGAGGSAVEPAHFRIYHCMDGVCWGIREVPFVTATHPATSPLVQHPVGA